jgi:hypothetical protein
VPLHHEALRARRIQRRAAGPLQQVKGDLRTAMDELGAELDRDGQPRKAPSPAAAADAAAGFQNEGRAACPRELGRRGEPRSTGANDDYVEDLRRNPIRP